MIEERVDSSTDPDIQHVWGLRYIDDIILRDRDTTANGTLDERLYGLQDANWNVTALSNSSGAIQERYTYAAYGSPVFLNASFGNRSSSSYDWHILYSGYFWVSENELYEIRNRTYNSRLGQWTSRDPLNSGEAINLYCYCKGIPQSRSDATGLLSFQDTICSILDDPCLGNFISCFCSLIELLDVLSNILPMPGPVATATSVADCVCDIADWQTAVCTCDAPTAETVALNTIIGCIGDIGMSLLALVDFLRQIANIIATGIDLGSAAGEQLIAWLSQQMPYIFSTCCDSRSNCPRGVAWAFPGPVVGALCVALEGLGELFDDIVN